MSAADRAVRVAVQVGAATVRVAVTGPDGGPRLVAAVPRERFRGLRALLIDIVGAPPGELVLVHPAMAPPAAVAAELAGATGLAAQVRAVPAPVAAATGTGAVAVLDVGHSGAEATVLQAGVVVAAERVPAGGAVLDAAVTCREALSLVPAEDEATREAVAAAVEPVLGQAVAALGRVLARACAALPAGPVLLVGGLARTPLLAELADAAGVPGVVVVERPESAAVLGALRAPAGPSVGLRVAARPPAWLPELPARPPRAALVRAGRIAAAAVCAAVAVAGLLGLGQLLKPAVAAPVSAASGELVQYGYRVALPAGWEHVGGLPERRRSLLAPGRARQGSDLIAVEASPLGYDAGAEPARGAAELRRVYDQGVAGGRALSGYDPTADYAGRRVTSYREEQPDGVVVDWYVVLDGDAQLSVGCQHTPTGAATVATACALVVATLQRT